jgi:hypothetical protein
MQPEELAKLDRFVAKIKNALRPAPEQAGQTEQNNNSSY